MFVTNCSNFARFRVFHNLFKVPLKFNYKTTEQVTFLIRLSEYVRTGLLKLGDFQRKNTTAKLKKKKKMKKKRKRKKKRYEQHRETILRDIYLHSISHCSHSGASSHFHSRQIFLPLLSHRVRTNSLTRFYRTQNVPFLRCSSVRLFPSPAPYFYRF